MMRSNGKRLICRWHRAGILALGVVLAAGCDQGGNLSGGGGASGDNGQPMMYNTSSCTDADNTSGCTFWMCTTVPEQFQKKIHCTANQPAGGPAHAPGSYTCPATGGGPACPGPGPGGAGGGSGPYTCHATETVLTCDAGPPGGTGGTGGAGGSGGPLPPMPMLCMQGGVNNEPEILVGYSPANGQSVDGNGQIKVWVTDEGAPIIAPGEQVDPNTGTITAPGDRAAKAADGYLWEPALYIAPQTAENGGMPHFPTRILGSYNSTTVRGTGMMVAGMDPPPAGKRLLAYTGEDIWDVASLGLSPGTYIAEFVIHDGDRDRGVGCVTIVIQ